MNLGRSKGERFWVHNFEIRLWVQRHIHLSVPTGSRDFYQLSLIMTLCFYMPISIIMARI